MGIGGYELVQLRTGLDGMRMRPFETTPTIAEGVLQASIYAAASVLEDVIVD